MNISTQHLSRSSETSDNHGMTSCQIVRDDQGRARLIPPRPIVNAASPAPSPTYEIHLRATVYARLLLGAHRFPTIATLSTETLSDESVYDDTDWMNQRYSPYLADG